MRIAALMDGVVLVVEAEKTRWEVANKVREALVQADANVLGVILNKRRFHIPEWLYKTL
jgi:Mrp family chromosome partitioning ATPase